MPTLLLTYAARVRHCLRTPSIPGTDTGFDISLAFLRHLARRGLDGYRVEMNTSVRMHMRAVTTIALCVAMVAACGLPSDDAPPSASPSPSPVAGTDPAPAPSPTPTVEPEPATTAGPARPDWLGKITLADRDDRSTPQELRDRQFPPPPHLPPPLSDEFSATISRIPSSIVARSSWVDGCPVELSDLRYVTMTFWGFDNQPHMGEIIFHKDNTEELIGVFEKLYDLRFPLEEMKISTREQLDAPRWGDENNTTGFECRPVTGYTDIWSQHAYGKAVDINPFHNPYRWKDALQPALAESYLDRDYFRRGMIRRGDGVVEAFDAIGWGWGGEWETLDDWQHFAEADK